jgi:hypothetical protein
VEDDGVRDHHGPVAAGGGPPAEVDVVAEDRQVVVEAAELLEDAAPDQHARCVHGEDLTDLVVLTLVVLARLEPGLATTGARDGHPDLEQALQRRPFTQLRAEDVRRGVGRGGGQEALEGLRCGVAVVVQEPDPLRGSGAWRRELLQTGSYRLGVRRAAGQGGDLVEAVEQEVRTLVPAPGVDGEDPADRGGLGSDSVDDGR